MGTPVSPLGGLWIPNQLGIQANWMWFVLDWSICVAVLVTFIAAPSLVNQRTNWPRWVLLAALTVMAFSNVAFIRMLMLTEPDLLVILIGESASLIAALVGIVAVARLVITGAKDGVRSRRWCPCWIGSGATWRLGR